MDYRISLYRPPALLEAYILLALEEKEKGIRYPFLVIDKATGAFAGSTGVISS